MLIAFNKPYGVLSQFTPDGSPNRPLGEFDLPAQVYPLGRLDADSEGLLLLSDEAGLNTRLLDPERGHRRTYWAQIERIPSAAALHELDFSDTGFQWIDCHDADQSVVSWLRHGRNGKHVVAVLNFTPRAATKLPSWRTSRRALHRAAE